MDDSKAADHPTTDPGDGRVQCEGCGKYVWMVTHSCKGVWVGADPLGVTQPGAVQRSNA